MYPRSCIFASELKVLDTGPQSIYIRGYVQFGILNSIVSLDLYEIKSAKAVPTIEVVSVMKDYPQDGLLLL